ncbi:MAG TPA: YIP1 family protein [Chthoniobacterales bacterium]
MSKIHLNRAQQSLGEFTPEEVAEGLRSGRFLPSDLAWREGMETWQPLSTFPIVTESVPPLPSEIHAPIAESPIAEPAAPEAVQLPQIAPSWERGEASFFIRILETLQEVLLSPKTTFARMPTTGGFGKPLTFYILLAWICMTISCVYSLGFALLQPETAQHGHDEVLAQAIATVMFLVLGPVFVTIGSFIGAGIWHVCLILTGGKTKPFEATYRVVCYAGGSASVLLLLPCCGIVVELFWKLYVLIIGLREAHGTTTSRVVLAVLLPMLVCCGLGVMIVALGITLPHAGHFHFRPHSM